MLRTFSKIVSVTSFFVGVAFFVILAAFSFYWMLITAFKPNSDLYNITNVFAVSTHRTD